MIQSNGKKVTIATIKGFINRELKNSNLYIRNKSDFDGMVDCVMPSNNQEWKKANASEKPSSNNLGINGAWFVGHSDDYFTAYADDNFIGYEVYNCCGSFLLAMKRLN